MIPALYKQFQHWSKKGSVYLISDTHFAETDMNWRWSLIKDYPFPVLDWMNEEYTAQCIADYIVWKINKVAHKDDTLIILGDVGDTSYIKQLKAGYKVLIKGNHDSGTENYIRSERCITIPQDEDIYKYSNSSDFIKFLDFSSRVGYFDNKLFDEVYEGPLLISNKILLSHEPIATNPQCFFNIHGHTHTGSNMSDNSEGFLCLTSEQIDFTPVSLGNLLMRGLLSNTKDIHRITIDKATEKKEKKVISSFSDEYSFLSNFYPCHIDYEGIQYPSTEHAFQAAKTFDVGLREFIAGMDTCGKAKRYARRMPIDVASWEERKLKVMEDILRIKFSNSDLKQRLLDTGDAILIEGNTWGDTFWGQVNDKGQNNLGKILMKIREDIKNGRS